MMTNDIAGVATIARAPATARKIVLRADNLGVVFDDGHRRVEAIRKVDFEFYQGETLAIVESRDAAQIAADRSAAAAKSTLAQKALDFALTGKAGTTSAAIITSVAGSNPDLAYDFTVAHRAQVEALIDDSGKSQFYRRLVGSSVDPAMVGKLEQLRGVLPEDQRKPIDQAVSSLKNRLASYPRMRAELHDWLAAHPA